MTASSRLERWMSGGVCGERGGVGVGCLTFVKIATTATMIDYAPTGGRCTSCRLCPMHSNDLARVRCSPRSAGFAL